MKGKQNIDANPLLNLKAKTVTILTAYKHKERSGNEVIDFDDCLGEEDIEALCANEIKEFTISSVFSSLLRQLENLKKVGYEVKGMKKVKTPYGDIVPALYLKYEG